ncbi:MAG: hypothetical protein AAF567_04930 [Actinomycetota bacterium]
MARAEDSLELEITSSSVFRRALGWLTVTVTGFLSLGEPWMKNPGSRRFLVKDRSTGEVVLDLNESIGDDKAATLAALNDDLASMTRDEFVSAWTPDPA